MTMPPSFYERVLGYEEEWERRGHFERVFPLLQNYAYYSYFFETLRPGSGNDQLWRYLEAV